MLNLLLISQPYGSIALAPAAQTLCMTKKHPSAEALHAIDCIALMHVHGKLLLTTWRLMQCSSIPQKWLCMASKIDHQLESIAGQA